MICPFKWRDKAAARAPSPCFMTDWIDGTQAPVRVGWYERHFTDSPNIGLLSMQFWDGEFWITKHGEAHWRQVGDYPAWRGLTEAQAAMQASAAPPLQEPK